MVSHDPFANLRALTGSTAMSRIGDRRNGNADVRGTWFGYGMEVGGARDVERGIWMVNEAA